MDGGTGSKSRRAPGTTGWVVAAAMLLAIGCGRGGAPGSRPAATTDASDPGTPDADASTPDADSSTPDSDSGITDADASDGKPDATAPQNDVQCAPLVGYSAPAADCSTVPASTTLLLPVHGLQSEQPLVTARVAVDDTLYVGLESYSCLKTCVTKAGVFRTQHGAPWETVVDGQARVVMDADASDLFWVRAPAGQPVTAGEPVEHVSPATLASSVAGTLDEAGFPTGIALLPGALFTMTLSADTMTSTLARRPVNGSTLGAASILFQLHRSAFWPRTDGQRLAWAEAGAMVVGDLSGNPAVRVGIGNNAEWRELALAGGRAFAAYETTPGSGSICAFDTASGKAATLVPPRPQLQICAVAANSTRVFWTQSGTPGSHCNQVWTAAPDGTSPELIGCDTEPIETVAATDHAVYWIGAEAHLVDPASL